MISIRNKTFESDENAQVVLSRLDWKVEKADRLVNPFSNSTVDTSRPWVGKIDKNKREFEIIQTAPHFSPRILDRNFFQLYIQGQITEHGQKSGIILKFRLGLNTFMLFIFIYLFPLLTTFLDSKTDNGNWKGLALSFIVPILFTLLLIVQLNRTENKLIDLFEV